MSKPLATCVHADLVGRRRRFELRLKEVGELERLCGVGVGEIALRLGTHRFTLADVRETIRLGLEGGGMSEAEATALMLRHFDGKNPLAQHLSLAMRIVEAFLNGLPDDAKDTSDKPTVERPPGDLADFHRLGGMMGLSATEVEAMTLRQFYATLDGFAKFHGVKTADGPGADEYARVLAEEMAAGRA